MTLNKILLIDDEKGIREIWKRFHDVAEPVFRGRLEMDVASDLAQGIERMKGTEYDALILDLVLPPLTQAEVISWIFENAKLPGIPIISVLTGDEDVYVRRRCIIGGAVDFWVKTDATDRPDLFFKSLYNEYLKRYAERDSTP